MIYHGDCLDIIPTLPPVDLILADMPYDTTNCQWDSVIDLQKLWGVLRHVRKQDTIIVLTAQTPFDKVLGCSNLSELRYEWVWEKSNPTGHLNAKRMPMKAHENILVFYKRCSVYNPIKTTGHVRKTATKRGDKTEIYNNQVIDEIRYDSTERYPRSILKFPSDKQKSKLHPTQKPVALMEYLIRTYTNPGAMVLDFCMGSGTTGIAARNCGREFTGIEINKEYFDIAKERWQ